MQMLMLFLQVTRASWLWPMLPLKVSSSGCLQFMRPISLSRGLPFFVGRLLEVKYLLTEDTGLLGAARIPN